MSRINWVVMVIVACVSGMVGAAMRAPVSVAAPAAEAAKVLRAERFELVDSQGKVRVEWGVRQAGTLVLRLYAKDGKTRTVLAVLPDGSPQLTLMDQDGKSRAAMAVGPDGSPELSLMDQNGKPIWKAPK